MNLIRVGALALVTLTGCAGGSPPAATPVSTAAATQAPTSASTEAPTAPTAPPRPPTPTATTVTGPASPSTAGLIDIGDRSLYLECWGEGSPTILFLHGGGGNHSHGNHLTTGYPATNRVCLYDRANMGESDSTNGTQTGADVVDDLNRLLVAGDVPGPYLLVANSFGGVVAELFAASNPDQIAGMVLVDASLHADADVDRYFDERGEIDLEAFEAEFAEGPEKILYSIHDEARDALASIPDVPIRYLRASESALPAEPQEIWNAGLDALLARSSDGIVIDVDGPHTLPPPPVHDAIDDILSREE